MCFQVGGKIVGDGAGQNMSSPVDYNSDMSAEIISRREVDARNEIAIAGILRHSPRNLCGVMVWPRSAAARDRRRHRRAGAQSRGAAAESRAALAEA